MKMQASELHLTGVAKMEAKRMALQVLVRDNSETLFHKALSAWVT